MRPIFTADDDRMCVRVELGYDAEENSDLLDEAVERVTALGYSNAFGQILLPPGRFPLERRWHVGAPSPSGIIRALWLRGQGTVLRWEDDDCGVLLENWNTEFLGGMAGIGLEHARSSTEGVGLHLSGMYQFFVEDLSVVGFGTGLLFDAESRWNTVVEAQAVAHCRVRVREMRDNLVGVTFHTGRNVPEANNRPYANVNTVSGGRWQGRPGRGSRHVVLRDAATSNLFANCSFDARPEHAVELGFGKTLSGMGVTFRSCDFAGSASGALFLVESGSESPNKGQYRYRWARLMGGSMRDDRLAEYTSGDRSGFCFFAAGAHLSFAQAMNALPWGTWTDGADAGRVVGRLPEDHLTAAWRY
ncbi:MAG: hypothetical protein ACOY3Y_08845 [Acidobacteriota bacterium]